MSDSIQQKLNGLSPVERLKATDKYLAEMNDVLKSMDEIAALRESRGEPASDEFGGYKRSTVVKFIAELEKQKAAILDEIARGEQRNAERAERDRAEKEKLMQEKQRLQEDKRALERAAALPAAQAQENNKAISELSQKVDSLAISSQDSAVASFRKGDTSLAIESMYTGLSLDIEKMRDDILQEMKYSYKQDMAIYDDLAEKIDSLKKADNSALEETLKPMGENLDAMSGNIDSISGSIVALDEKVSAIRPVDYEEIAEKVASRVVTGGIDYDVLAEHIVGIMTGNNAPQPKQEDNKAEFSSMEKKIDELKDTLNGAVSVKQMPEFKKLDELIAEYLRTLSYDSIPDMLIAANAIKDLANRYIVSGNALRGETMLSDLRMRLERVSVWGSSAVVAVDDAVKQHNLPVTYAKDALESFKDALREFEQSPALPSDELVQKVLRAKKNLFCDSDMEAMDKDTFAEMLEIREESAGVYDENKIMNLTELKKELMSFNLSYFVDMTPALPEEKEAPASSVDTQVILEAIARLGVASQKNEPVEEVKEEDIRAKLEELSKNKPATVGKKPKKVLRPAISSKDNKVEKTEQPLRTVKRSIKLGGDDNPDSLSKQIVEELAVKIANSRVK
ncbi:MAG TPA: hypothetical protein H9729_06995 [Candidatus Borkfalkia excrementigallinarum]|uniref:Uncharacterized protein n=1 Tax=Candidatus Borkfalkia excrementigallinarum TaxID=2838506 RepID=A0A9D1ZVU9_9FIRM|nr:hypothetical protein [Candidatus Borkfalkia excrementigallinarum]